MKKNETAESNGEMAADLAALDLAAAAPVAAETAAAVQAESVQAAARLELADEIKGLVSLAVPMLAPVFPCLPGIYTEPVTAAAAEAIAAVCKKHGWLPDGIAGGYGEEVTAAVVLLPLAFTTYRGCREDLDVKKPGAPLPLPGAGGAPVEGCGNVVIGGTVVAPGG